MLVTIASENRVCAIMCTKKIQMVKSFSDFFLCLLAPPPNSIFVPMLTPAENNAGTSTSTEALHASENPITGNVSINSSVSYNCSNNSDGATRSNGTTSDGSCSINNVNNDNNNGAHNHGDIFFCGCII